MLKKRIIPILQISKERLVKTTKFKYPKYVGDPINAVRIFNEKKVDEIIILDIENRQLYNDLNYEIIRDLADECRMPFAYGGGIHSIKQVEKLFSIGVEKIVLNNSILNNYDLIRNLSSNFGSQSIVVAVDINNDTFKKKKLYDWKIKKNLNKNIDVHISRCIENGAGEILINSVYREGTLNGFDFSLLKDINLDIDVPLILNGGINSNDEINSLLSKEYIDALAIGAKFIYYGPHRAVLISYIHDQERL